MGKKRDKDLLLGDRVRPLLTEEPDRVNPHGAMVVFLWGEAADPGAPVGGKAIEQPDHLEEVARALSEISPWNDAVGQGRLSFWWKWSKEPPRKALLATGSWVLSELGGVTVNAREPYTLLTDGARMPFQGRRWSRTFTEAEADGDAARESTVDTVVPRSSILPVVVIRGLPDADPDARPGDEGWDHHPIDTKEIGPWPYTLVLSSLHPAASSARCIAKCLGKLLGLGEESADPNELSAPDSWGRALPNVWSSHDPENQLVPWVMVHRTDLFSKLEGQPHAPPDPLSVNEVNSEACRRGAFGVPADDPLYVGRPESAEPCLMGRPLLVEPGGEGDAGQYCDVCAGHLRAALGLAGLPNHLEQVEEVREEEKTSFGLKVKKGKHVGPWVFSKDVRLWSDVAFSRYDVTTATTVGTNLGEERPALAVTAWSDGVRSELTYEVDNGVLGITIAIRLRVDAPSEGEQTVKAAFSNPSWCGDGLRSGRITVPAAVFAASRSNPQPARSRGAHLVAAMGPRPDSFSMEADDRIVVGLRHPEDRRLFGHLQIARGTMDPTSPTWFAVGGARAAHFVGAVPWGRLHGVEASTTSIDPALYARVMALLQGFGGRPGLGRPLPEGPAWIDAWDNNLYLTVPTGETRAECVCVLSFPGSHNVLDRLSVLYQHGDLSKVRTGMDGYRLMELESEVEVVEGVDGGGVP